MPSKNLLTSVSRSSDETGCRNIINAGAVSEFDKRLKRFPRTRYQGSKRKLAAAILGELADLEFHSALDAFGGTGAVAYALKCAGKAVTYNDALAFNHQVGLALIENDSVRLDDTVIERIGQRQENVTYDDTIERFFDGIYFTSEENRWLDAAVANISNLSCKYRRAMAWFALFQSAMAKRPYNLFHRSNLYMREADVPRSFGNKVSWDRSFDEHFRSFAEEANAALFGSTISCRSIRLDVLDIEPDFDLVYIDTPYISGRGVGVDYRDFYHFLEGMMHYDRWPAMIDARSKHRRLGRIKDPWSDPRTCRAMFRRVFERFRESILAVSYRSDGIPAIDELSTMLAAVKPHVRTVTLKKHQYALSTRRTTKEVLLIGTD